MICRLAGDEIILISQIAHARLAADLAAEIGNENFTSPLPRQAVLDAVAMHDAGWPAHDDSPTINARGLPAHALEMPLQTMLPIWSASTDLTAAIHPYAGLLVSLHGLSLSARAHITASELPLIFALNKFQHRQIELQEEFRQKLGMSIEHPLHLGLAEPVVSPEEDLLRFDFELLELTDQLSLNICFGESRLPSIDGVHPRPGHAPLTMRFIRDDRGDFLVDPWPFARDELIVKFPTKIVPARTYSDHKDFHAEFTRANDRALQVRLLRPK